jgi:hypothetical protein
MDYDRAAAIEGNVTDSDNVREDAVGVGSSELGKISVRRKLRQPNQIAIVNIRAQAQLRDDTYCVLALRDSKDSACLVRRCRKAASRTLFSRVSVGLRREYARNHPLQENDEWARGAALARNGKLVRNRRVRQRERSLSALFPQDARGQLAG